MGKFRALAVALTLAMIGGAAAEDYPSRPITVVVPFPAGGGTDRLARVLAEQMKVELGQAVIVEDVGGAGGSLGVARVAHATPDGYTLVFGNWASNVGSGAVYPVDYDLLKDFEPIARIADAPLWLVARKNFPANDLREAIAWLKANPGKATAATVGVGSGSHLCGIYLQNALGVTFQFIPYRGGAPAKSGPDCRQRRHEAKRSRAQSRTITACSACARAMPIDTAVAATSSETASASVANISTPARRRLANVFSSMGDAKPAFPVSSVIDVSSLANQFVALSQCRVGLGQCH